MNYEIALKKTDEGFAVWCPSLRGCWSQGATESEAIENIRDAIREYLAAIHDEAERQAVEEADVRLVEVTV